MVLCNNTRKVGSKLKKGIKTLAMWLIIGVIAIVLITSIMENRSSQITYSELITSIENGEKTETMENNISYIHKII